MEYQIITDGSCDLPKELVKEKNLTVVSFYVTFDDKNYMKEMVDIEVQDFYDQMIDKFKEGVFPKSSMPSVQDYVDVFLPAVEQGKGVICICITTKFSGSWLSAMNARNMILEDYPKARITVIDSTVDTVLQGIYVLEAVKMQEAGMPYEEVIANLERIKTTGRIFFTVGNIDYLKHGGRIGKLSGLAGSVLGIKPLITLKEGEIFPSGIARVRRKSMDKVIDLMVAYLEELKADIADFSVTIGFGHDRREAEEFRERVIMRLGAKYPIKELPVFQIGATIGVHTGPYPIGLALVRRYDA